MHLVEPELPGLDGLAVHLEDVDADGAGGRRRDGGRGGRGRRPPHDHAAPHGGRRGSRRVRAGG